MNQTDARSTAARGFGYALAANAYPNPRAAVERASVWFTAYPLSLITAPGQSFLAALGDEDLWKAFEQIGIEAIHTGPVKRAGGINGWEYDPQRGRAFRPDQHGDRSAVRHRGGVPRRCARRPRPTTARHRRHRSRAHRQGRRLPARRDEPQGLPGIYHMVDIPEEDWHLLPDVPPGQDSVNIDAGHREGFAGRRLHHRPAAAGDLLRARREGDQLERHPRGGRHQRQDRRWVYLHYFKAGQPSINWLDPTFSGMRLVHR